MTASHRVVDFLATEPHLGYPIESVVDAVEANVKGFGKFTVLDIGCGFGHVTAALAERLTAATVVGVDLEPEVIRLAERRATETANGPRVTFRVEDLRRTRPSDGERYDVLIFLAAQQAFRDPADIAGWLAEYGTPRAFCVLDRAAVILPGRIDHERQKFEQFEAALGHPHLHASYEEILSEESSCSLIDLLDARLARDVDRAYLHDARQLIASGSVARSVAKLYVVDRPGCSRSPACSTGEGNLVAK